VIGLPAGFASAPVPRFSKLHRHSTCTSVFCVPQGFSLEKEKFRIFCELPAGFITLILSVLSYWDSLDVGMEETKR
jgi:hypothetical protein